MMGVSVLLLASAVSTLGGLVFGYELGIISGALLQVRAEFGLSCVQQEALVSSLLVGALLASVVGGFLIDHRGRRTSILLSNVLILTGSLVLLMGSFPALLLGRAIVGFAMCVSSMSCCIFVSELVTPDRRGVLVTLYEAGITVGILAAYAVNYILSDSRGGWRWMFGLAVAPTVIQLASIWFLPSGRKEPASQRYRDLMSTAGNREDDDDSKVISGAEAEKYDSLFLFRRRDNMRTRTVIGLGLVLFQQLTGQPTVLLYASTVFRSVGFRSDASAVLASVGLGLVKVVVTLTSMVFSDRVGRRPLLIGGCSLMAVCLVTIGLLSGRSSMDAETPCGSGDVTTNGTDLPRLAEGNATFRLLYNDTHLEAGQKLPDALPSPGGHGTVVNWIILVCMMGVVSAYSFGFGPMTWLLLSEIFPAAIRGRAFAFTNCFNWAANLLVTFTFLNCIDAMGLSGMFLLYGATAVAAALFFYLVLPETKGKSLEEIDKELRLNKFYHGCIRNASPQYQRVHCQESTTG